jgi:hypothetical protein
LQVENRLAAIDADGKRTAAEAAEIANLYTVVTSTPLAKDANSDAKTHYAHVRKLLSDAQFANYRNMKFRLVMTGIDSAKDGFAGLPGNIGATRALDAVTGAYLVQVLGEKRAYKIMAQAKSPVEQFNGLPVTPGNVSAGGGRIVGLDGIVVPIEMSDAAKIVGVIDVNGKEKPDAKGLGRLTPVLYKQVTNKDDSDGEMRRAYLVAETCKDYDLPKPADKK